MKYIRNRMVEFRERIGPLLKELNLRSQTQENDGGIEVYFVPRKKEHDPYLSHSTVSIFFDDRETTGLREATWERAWLSVEQHERRPIGDTGWYHRRWWDSEFSKLPTEREEMWQFIEQNFRERPFVTMEIGSDEIESEELYDAYQNIVSLPEHLRIEGLAIEQQLTDEGLVESIVFDDVHGRQVRLEFHQVGAKCRAFVDGEPVGFFHNSRESTVATMAYFLYADNSERAGYHLRF